MAKVNRNASFITIIDVADDTALYVLWIDVRESTYAVSMFAGNEAGAAAQKPVNHNILFIGGV